MQGRKVTWEPFWAAMALFFRREVNHSDVTPTVSTLYDNKQQAKIKH